MVLKETPDRKEIILYYFMLILGKFKNQTVKKKNQTVIDALDLKG